MQLHSLESHRFGALMMPLSLLQESCYLEEILKEVQVVQVVELQVVAEAQHC